MISGQITLEDTIIDFHEGSEEGSIMVTITDIPTQRSACSTVDQAKFFKALAIAVHNDGMPDWQEDYADAESIMPKDPILRWIP